MVKREADEELDYVTAGNSAMRILYDIFVRPGRMPLRLPLRYQNIPGASSHPHF
jgi:hypothetical protein